MGLAITAQTPVSLRSNFTGRVGFAFTPNKDLYVTSLGRWVVSGNSASHNVAIYTTANALVVTAAIATSGKSPNAYTYVSVTKTKLSSGVTYYMSSEEISGGDQWYQVLAITPSGDLSIPSDAYYDGTWHSDASTANQAFVPLNFQYDLTAGGLLVNRGMVGGMQLMTGGING